jgi:hypothetical protein
MAYPTVDKPYGLKPVNLIGGQVFAGATRQRRIASGAASIGYGDPLEFDTDGTVKVAAITTAVADSGFAGVFLGCNYVSSVTGQPTYSQSWISGTSVKSGTFIYAYVADDPDTLFKAVGVSASLNVSTTSGFVYSDIGTNVALVNEALNTTTGDSQRGLLLSSVATTRSLPIRIVDVVEDTAFVSSGTTYYPEVIVKFNAPYTTGASGVVVGGHAYYNPLGT